MADAADTPAKSRSRKEDPASPIGEARARWAKEEKENAKGNPVVETFYMLSCGHKLILCKKKKNGSVYKTFVGSMNDKDSGAQVTAKVRELEAKRELRVTT